MKPELFVIDVDGVMTTGHFIYSDKGKVYKIFGPDDSDGLSLLKKYIKVRFVTGDKRGFEISKKRIYYDMGYDIDLVSTTSRKEWISNLIDIKKVIYMGDGLLDSIVLSKCGYAICPKNASHVAKKYSNYITRYSGGDRAVADACLHILEKFFEPFDPDTDLSSYSENFGHWTA